MQQNLQIPTQLASELVALVTIQAPLTSRIEEVKDALRTFGSADYLDGQVKVGNPSVSKQTNTVTVLNLDVWSKLDPEAQGDLIKRGLVIFQDVFSQNRKAGVTVK